MPSARQGGTQRLAAFLDTDPERLYIKPLGIIFDADVPQDHVLPELGGCLAGAGRFVEVELIRRIDGGGADRLILPLTAVTRWLADESADGAARRLARLLRQIEMPRAGWAGFAPDRRPLVMGIVNVTPDSFSDGGDTADPERAVAAGLAQVAAGADIVDVGGESTRPGARPVAPDIEIARVVPVVTRLAGAGVTVSIDTRHAEVMRAALDAGARIVNDVASLADAGAAALVARRRVPVILMHMQGEPPDMQAAPAYLEPLLDVFDGLESRIRRATEAGISISDILVDPGIGFGKTTAHNLAILRGLALLHGLGPGIALGVSRKGLIPALARDAAAPKQRLGGSLALALDAMVRGVRLLRVHDVAETVQAVRLAEAARGLDR